MRQIILALPAYNESENIESLLRSAHSVLTASGSPFQLVVVNDGSTDSTAKVVDGLATELGVVLVNHPVNRGLGGAITTCIDKALELSTSPDDIVVSMDADNTHSPDYIPSMVSKIWEEDKDVVIASRFCSGSKEVGVPLFRLLLSRGARVLFRIFLKLPEVRDYTCGYRAYRAGVLRQAVAKYGDGLITRQGFACTDELLVKLSTLTRKITEVPFVLRYDKKRSRSKLPLARTIWETLKMLLVKH